MHVKNVAVMEGSVQSLENISLTEQCSSDKTYSSNVSLSGKKDPVPSNQFPNAETHLREEIAKIAKAVEKYATLLDRNLNIHVDCSKGEVSVKVISAKDGKVVREITPKQMIDLVTNIDKMTGVFYNETT